MGSGLKVAVEKGSGGGVGGGAGWQAESSSATSRLTDNSLIRFILRPGKAAGIIFPSQGATGTDALPGLIIARRSRIGPSGEVITLMVA
jgi:hypothetical protein